MSPPDAATTLSLAEKIFAILDEGAFSATYKYAVMLALLDLSVEKLPETERTALTLTTRELARKVLELYWPQCVPYEGHAYLRQGGGHDGQQAEIVREIIRFRRDHGGSESLWHAASNLPHDVERLLNLVEWKLIEMPLPRLQFIGRSEERFLYQYQWTQNVRQSAVSAYQRGDPDAFDNRVILGPHVAASLIALNNLLRPFIQREWLRLVQQFNRARVPESRLEQFLFERDREALARIRDPLVELQERACFYCDERLDRKVDVDHFIPWARYPNNAIDNLVASHARCNNQKRDFLTASAHVKRWCHRRKVQANALQDLARDFRWESPAPRSQAVALALYQQLPDDARVWRLGSEFARYEEDREQVLTALQSA